MRFMSLPCAMASRWSVGVGLAVVAAGALVMLSSLAGHAKPSANGQTIFRSDTFGNEQLWTDTLGLHEVIETSVDPLTAFSVGLKVDVDALPADVYQAIVDGELDLTSPATTLALLRLDAIVGVVGTVDDVDGVARLTRVGITCALCHSTVEDSLAPGIGHRRDGWPNLDLDPGAIIALSPAVPAAAKAVYQSWGPGKYDPRFNIDGKSTPLVIPPAYGLAGVEKETFTAEGPISYWNKYVAVTQMGGQGTFVDPRLGIRIVHKPDLVTRKLAPLREYQLGLATPAPPPGSFDPAAAAEGKALFHGTAACATCHVPPLFTDVNLGVLHQASEVGQDPAYAQRTTTGKYRTTPLRGLWQHPPYFHDGSAATLLDVVEHYDAHFGLGLTDLEKEQLVEYLKSL